MSLRLRVPGERVGTTHSYVKLQCDTPNLSFLVRCPNYILIKRNRDEYYVLQRMNGKKEWQKDESKD